MNGEGLAILLGATVVVAFTHTFAPDHWVPFTMIGRAQRWSVLKVALVTLAAGVVHVGSSVVIGLVAISFGWILDRATGFEAWRGPVALWGLVGFGFLYALWGLKDIRHGHTHAHVGEAVRARKSITVWALVIIFVLGPCEPLIPLMFKAYEHGAAGAAAVAGVFGVITVAQMAVLSTLAFLGLSLAWTSRFDRFTHTIAGATVALTGLMVIVLGI